MEKKRVLIGAGAALGLFGLWKSYGLYRISQELVTEIGLSVPSVDASSPFNPKVRFVADVRIKNPTGTSIKLKHPTVSLFSGSLNGTRLATSQVVDKKYKVMAHGETALDPINLTIEGQSALTIVGDALRNGKITLAKKVMSKINSVLNYTDTSTEEIDISSLVGKLNLWKK